MIFLGGGGGGDTYYGLVVIASTISVDTLE